MKKAIMKFLDYLVLLLLFLIFLFAASSCSRSTNEVMCIEIYQPVCYNGELYTNECYAMKAGANNAEITPAECILNLAGCECN